MDAEARHAEGPILVVDDDAVNRQLAVDFLTYKGFAAVAAASASEAWRALCEMVPSLVILDIQMPETSGLELLRRIRSGENPAVSAVSVIAATAMAMKGDRERCLESGADAYLSRPFSWSELLATIEAVRGPHAFST